jgi:predicted KAP-like P-loop ATPase
MWADNETRIDLLGFDFLVDELLVILRDARLLPVTVGVAGDWGSGKTSLIGMADEALRDDQKFLTVTFSPVALRGLRRREDGADGGGDWRAAGARTRR